MRNVKLTEKERDAIRCMIRYWWDIGQPFKTRTHGKFNEEDMEKLMRKMKHG